nr:MULTISPECIES: cytochrome c oxidase assembly protein [Corynebacterium]
MFMETVEEDVKANPGEQSPTSARMKSPAVVYILATLVAGLVAALIGFSFVGDSLAILGIPDPGALTTFGLPLVRGMAQLIACIGIGGFLMSAFGAPPRKDGYLDLDGFRAARTGTWGMALFALLSVLLVPMYLSDVSGQPLKTALNVAAWDTAVEQVSASKTWMWVAIFAGVVAMLSLLTRKWIFQPIFLAISILSLIPLALEGHSASGGSHDHGVNTLLWHIVFTALWVGGLCALIAHAKRRGPHLTVITERYSFLALFSIIVLAISGVINALLRVDPADWFTTKYGLVIMLKALLTLILAGFGWMHRSRIIPVLRVVERPDGTMTDAQRAPFIRLAIGEVLVMAATIGVAISLSRIPPPLENNPDLTQQDILLGFTLTEPPSMMAYLTHWRFDLVFGTGALLLQAVYVWAYVVLKRRGVEWPTNRLVWWTLGNVTLIAVTCSGMGMYAMAMFSPHMLQHMFLTMVIPVFWALGGPMTILLRALPPAGRNGVPGPREWLVVFINNPVSRFLTNPVVAGVQFVIGFYYLYMSSLFDKIAPEHAGHLFMMIHFLISGYIFYWVVIGVDAAPRQLSPFMKMLVLFAVVTFHVWFGIAMMQMANPLNEDFYRSLNLPFEVDLLADQHLGGALTWGLGEIPLLIVTAAHGVQWLRTDRKQAARYDRHEERSGDEELRAYNDMLAGLASGQGDMGENAYYGSEYHTNSVHSALHSDKHGRKKHT